MTFENSVQTKNLLYIKLPSGDRKRKHMTAERSSGIHLI